MAAITLSRFGLSNACIAGIMHSFGFHIETEIFKYRHMEHTRGGCEIATGPTRTLATKFLPSPRSIWLYRCIHNYTGYTYKDVCVWKRNPRGFPHVSVLESNWTPANLISVFYKTLSFAPLLYDYYSLQQWQHIDRPFLKTYVYTYWIPNGRDIRLLSLPTWASPAPNTCLSW